VLKINTRGIIPSTVTTYAADLQNGHLYAEVKLVNHKHDENCYDSSAVKISADDAKKYYDMTHQTNKMYRGGSRRRYRD
jgi:hypothetical protein